MTTINLRTEQFKNQIYDLINQNELPISLTYYIFKEITENIEKAQKVAVKRELDQLKKQQQEKQEEEKQKEQTIEQ